MAVQVPKKPLELGDCLVANVVPNLEYRAVSPEITLAPSVATQTPTDSPRRGHADVHDLMPRATTTSRRHMAIEDVDTSQPWRQTMNFGAHSARSIVRRSTSQCRARSHTRSETRE